MVRSAKHVNEMSMMKTTLLTVLTIGVIAGICMGVIGGTGAFNMGETNDTYKAPVGALSCHKCYKPDCNEGAGVQATCSKPAVSISAGDSNYRFTITFNNWPCHDMDGEDEYAVCPTSTTESFSFPIPELCNADDLYYNGHSCFHYDSQETQPHFGEVGVMGRPPYPSSHWSSSNIPIEAVTYDPLPAECADIEAHACGQIYGGDQRFSVIDIQRLNDDDEDVRYTDGLNAGEKVNVAIDDYNGHVQPQGNSGGLYHYHGPPGWDDTDYANYVIGYAADGVPIMGRGSLMTNSKQGTASYKLRQDKKGEYHMDYEFVDDAGTLDRLNGGYATIDGVSTYAYFSTSTYPYVFRNFKGVYQ